VPLADPERALVVIGQVLHCLRHLQSPEEGWEGKLTDPYDPYDMPPHEEFGTYLGYIKTLKKMVVGRQRLLEEIAEQIDPGGLTERFRKDAAGSWAGAEEAVLRLRGILEFEADHKQILGPQGPTLSAEGLHPWVWNAATNLWSNEHYGEAVAAAAKAVEKQAQLKLDRRDLTGYRLYSKLFVSKNHLEYGLVFPQFDTETENWTSAHDGARHYGMGCALRIRNLLVHGAIDVSEQTGLEYLAALSLLARWIDAAERSIPKGKPHG